MTKNIAVLLGVVFLLVGALGYIPNPIVGEGAIFHTDMVHNLIHIVSGLVLLVAGLKSQGAAALGLKVIGVIYLLVTILGFMAIDATGQGSILNLVAINQADNWLHVALALVLLGAGFSAKKDEVVATPSQPMM